MGKNETKTYSKTVLICSTQILTKLVASCLDHSDLHPEATWRIIIRVSEKL